MTKRLKTEIRAKKAQKESKPFKNPVLYFPVPKYPLNRTKTLILNHSPNNPINLNNNLSSSRINNSLFTHNSNNLNSDFSITLASILCLIHPITTLIK